MNRVPLLLLLCLALGCDIKDFELETFPGVSLTATFMVPPAGPRVGLTLANGSTARIGYRMCPTTIERREGSEWVPTDWLPVAECSAEYQTLEGGNDAGEAFNPVGALRAGTYRARATVWRPFGAPQQITSNSFDVP